jgi:transcription elongation GreA/GreB family factor
LIGWRAPVAKALMGHGTGDSVVVRLTGSEVELTTLAVRNTPHPA